MSYKSFFAFLGELYKVVKDKSVTAVSNRDKSYGDDLKVLIDYFNEVKIKMIENSELNDVVFSIQALIEFMEIQKKILYYENIKVEFKES